MERAIGPPPIIRILRTSVSRGRRLRTNLRTQRHSTRPLRLLANIVKAARGRTSSHAAMKTNAIANRVDRARTGATAAEGGCPAWLSSPSEKPKSVTKTAKIGRHAQGRPHAGENRDAAQHTTPRTLKSAATN